ncbi:MAG: 4-hydroxy-tetrahydrodipicolinate reductase [SAR202 cluster bacterium]|jgi:4-hydroxy-tetrahydrodipicolinate reductase|nr:4-hydroxy-tetrahydrodipicolinate reductase [SAR202 cluster bacterium]MDP6301217.1 4-hydroxy-tetrahydrodipicolinate reductase [SAR202 cluster bacterium]MDP7102610.1 4-hydroxy-tetrahydrodipicolinate reductase [SAR202 cluster bacterium]MDP7224390.1 4-hydroxy-tetrahydrodipicolinate reductase [SAR202 cluster bacterium]MDP7414512.1 4-hydroxy-tetrahydrodipicolinate reductase [SAR202 cluster bacterium]|tara:strand:+ start:211 stop:1002 length:792 start_codon:yes stop_codon:yes gene_type:complete
MADIKVVVHGALGRMGQEVLRAVTNAPDMQLVGAADGRATPGTLMIPDGSAEIPISNSLADALSDAQVVVDFSSAAGAMSVLRTASAHRVNAVVGSTGLSDDNFAETKKLADDNSVGIIIAPNFAMGAVLMIHLAEAAAKFFDYVDLTEMHHEAKIDAPSGTAMAIARALVAGKSGQFTAPKAQEELVEGARGGDYEGVVIHSARMPGLMAHHEVVFGALGQTLTIRHDSINRESFMPGVTMAIREVVNRKGLTVGLDKIMGL